jgi:adsorption protein B
VEAAVGAPVDLCLATRSDLAFAIRRGYERLRGGEPRTLLGAVLVDQGLLAADQLSRALKSQRRSYARIGDLLVELGHLTSEQLQAAVERHAPGKQRLGEFLVAHAHLRREWLAEALDLQRARQRPLGRVLGDEGILPVDVAEAAIEKASDAPLLSAAS